MIGDCMKVPMSGMNELKQYLDKEGVLGVVRSTAGDIRLFQRRGVIDLYTLLTQEPDFMRGGCMADKVIGRGAALLLVKGGIAEVYARLISSSALEVLRASDVVVTFDKEVEHIINRDGTGICPVEKLTSGISDPDEAFLLIGEFLKNK